MHAIFVPLIMILISQLAIMSPSWAWPHPTSLCQTLLKLSSCHGQSRLGTKCTLLYRPSSHEFHFLNYQRFPRNQQVLLKHGFLVLIEIELSSLRDQWQTQEWNTYLFKERKISSPDLHPWKWCQAQRPTAIQLGKTTVFLQSVFYVTR